MSAPYQEAIPKDDSTQPRASDFEATVGNPSDSEKSSLNSASKIQEVSKVRWILVCAGLFLGALLYGLDTTIAASVQGPILLSLGEIDKLAWVGIGFPMGAVAVILLIGRFYSLFEIKYLMIGAVITFEAGSALCGAAPSMNAMIVGRVIAGMGGAGMYLGALTYISIFTPLATRPIYNALIGLCWGTGCILGPLIGGGFAVSSATWRWAFYINLPLAAALSPIYIFLFPKHCSTPTIPTVTKLATIDWIGVTLNASVFTLFQVVLTFSGSTWKWTEAGPIALWASFAVCLTLYVIQQTFSIFTTPEKRIFPVHFLKSRTMILLYVGTAAAATGLAVGVYYIPLFFQFTRGDSAIKAAIRLLPFIVLNVFFVMFSGAILPMVAKGLYAPFYLATGIFTLIGGVLMYRVHVSTGVTSIYGFEILVAIGSGLTMQVAYSVAVAKAAKEDAQNAIGFINTAQIGTIAISLSIAASVFQNRGFINLRDALAGYNFTEDELRGALSGVQSAILKGGNAVVTQKAIEAIAKTIDSIWILVIAAGAVAFVCGVTMKWEKVDMEMVAGG
ncbi:MFS general substrate transporter [Mollisia scopiformis]|uniref:MFS general substrate transporter n=1 Tax=Mollisia scopiformis TaxID=149040 RepID=A0A194WUB0_MOLSC|nr:MFS general substrate transporter [Mollisia scopiformis]KUJ11259.1 MFS general substrate transporter [Mollisia scopiformis]